MIILLPPPYLSLAAIDANGRSDFPPHLLLSFLSTQPAAHIEQESELDIGSPPPRSLPDSPILRLCRCRFCACWGQREP